jgi:hypothetical protein
MLAASPRAPTALTVSMALHESNGASGVENMPLPFVFSAPVFVAVLMNRN